MVIIQVYIVPHLNLAHSTFLEFGEIKAIQGIGE